MAKKKYSSVKEFWPYYVTQHQKKSTRYWHFVGNTNLFIWLLAAWAERSLWILAGGVVTSYAFAWVGHFIMERNRPATFDYPVLSALCDMKMYGLMWLGKMDAEMEKYANSERLDG